MRVYIRAGEVYTAPIRWTLELVQRHVKVSFEWVELRENADLIYDHQHRDTAPIALPFYVLLTDETANLSHEVILDESIYLSTSKGEVDILATIFYLVNCVQEWRPDAKDLDHYERFRYERSLQNRFGIIRQNVVQQLLTEWWQRHNIKMHLHKSALFLSHDIDSLYGSVKEDGFWALKRGRIDILLGLILQSFIGKHQWHNIDRLIGINADYDIKATYFWLTENRQGQQGIKNADYSIHRETSSLKRVEQAGSVNGLHKSSTKKQLAGEMDRCSLLQPYNRYHFLRYLPMRDWPKLEQSSMRLDGSMGFAESMGFRNSYGWPFRPFLPDKGGKANFVVTPLTIMDRTLRSYCRTPVHQTADQIIDFMEQHRHNAVLSILWHNVFLTKYKYGGYLEEYKKILAYCYEAKWENLLPEDVIALVDR